MLQSFGEDRALILNFGSLAGAQAISLIIPLLIYPYLISIIGVANFGMVALAQSLVTFFVIVVDYGFNLTGNRDASRNRSDPKKLSLILSTVLSVKIVLTLLSFLLLSVLVFAVPKFRVEYELFLWSFAVVIGQTSLSNWLFQGIEQMKYVVYANLIAKIGFVIMILLMIRVESDYLYVNLYWGVAHFLGSLRFSDASRLAVILNP